MRKIRAILLPFILVASLGGCGRLETIEESPAPDVVMKVTSVDCSSGSMFVIVDVDGDWTATLDFGGEDAWAELGVTSGSGRRVDVDLYYDENPDEDNSRILKLIIAYEGGTIERKLIQYPQVSSDPVPDWMELPEVSLNEGQYFFYHNQTLANMKKIRSWSYLWDLGHFVSHWVAYPLNREMIGNGSRTDKWGYDPKLTYDMQPHIAGYYSKYQRGHQIPSADRLNYDANVQTFYGTNMTPQEGGLNGGVWARLEGQVRDWSSRFDTLYVVTGCVVEGSTEKVQDDKGRDITVPAGYFKALLGYSKNYSIGMTAQTGGYTGVAFYMDHYSYPSDYMEAAMTIRDLEKKTGFNFFVNLPAKITMTLSDKVETSKDNFWYE